MGFLALLLFGLGLSLYFAPTLVAASRRKRNVAAIFALNFFLGWTIAGWVVSLVWALTVEGERL